MKRSKFLQPKVSPNTIRLQRNTELLHSNFVHFSCFANFVKALNSTAPSTLDSRSIALLQQKQTQRLSQGRGNIPITNQYALPSDLQKQYNLAFTSTEPPPLKSTIEPNPPIPNTVFDSCQDESPTTLPESATAMSTIRQLNSKYTHKLSNDKKTVTCTKSVWDSVMAELHKQHNDNEQIKKDNRILQQDNINKNKEIDRLEQIEKAHNKLLKKKSKSKKGKGDSREDEANEDVKSGIQAFVKDILFRTVKFAVPGDTLNAAAVQVWNAIKDNMKLDVGPNAITLEDFTEIYGATILRELSQRRQYCQTRCKLAADGA